MLLTGDFQDGWNGLIVILQDMSNVACNVLIDKNNSDIISLRKVTERFFYLCESSISFNNKKIRGVCCAVSNSSEEEPTDGILREKSVNKLDFEQRMIENSIPNWKFPKPSCSCIFPLDAAYSQISLFQI